MNRPSIADKSDIYIYIYIYIKISQRDPNQEVMTLALFHFDLHGMALLRSALLCLASISFAYLSFPEFA